MPYEGGSGAIYYKWKRYLSPSIKLVPIELKGRGKRFNEKLNMPKHMFFSGYQAPSIPRKKIQIYTLPDEEFIKEVIKLGGTPQEVAKNEELLSLFAPILRSDFKILEEYIYKEMKEKIQCDISIFNGKKDDITKEEILAWKDHGDKDFKVYNFDGNHFFINDNVERITEIINNTLIKEGKY
ncbi:thioesterase domain-containing protein [Clostridium sp. C8-1-8]|uniref:thioesterase II family protein n=1 Tax=Clostridium sp. C8-1-8 TaxID=2698831 RepID=UPI001FAE230C|nr:thioesterase domain-containing protein [Clostridium sp. C8-1-8]